MRENKEPCHDRAGENRGDIEPPPAKFGVAAPVSDQDVADHGGSQAVGDADVISDVRQEMSSMVK